MPRSTNVVPYGSTEVCVPIFSPMNSVSNSRIVRSVEDRRSTITYLLPYITEEGLVLIDRREHIERRLEKCKH